jgi:hypothetical protein
MPASRYRGLPMTLANMCQNGMRPLSVTCELCRHMGKGLVGGEDVVAYPARESVQGKIRMGPGIGERGDAKAEVIRRPIGSVRLSLGRLLQGIALPPLLQD